MRTYRTHVTLWTVICGVQCPANPRAQYNLGAALADEKHWPEAIARYEEALRLAPDLIKIRNNLGAAFLNAGRLPEAIATLEEVVRQKPAFPEARYNLGHALLESGKPRDAIVQLQAALRLKPRDAMTLRGLGDALAETGRNAEAAGFYAGIPANRAEQREDPRQLWEPFSSNWAGWSKPWSNSRRLRALAAGQCRHSQYPRLRAGQTGPGGRSGQPIRGSAPAQARRRRSARKTLPRRAMNKA